MQGVNFSPLASRNEIQEAVRVQVSDRDRTRVRGGPKISLRPKSATASSKQDGNPIVVPNAGVHNGQIGSPVAIEISDSQSDGTKTNVQIGPGSEYGSRPCRGPPR